MRDNNPYRLSPTAQPTKYEILLRPDLEEFSFSGEVVITITIYSETTSIELNSNKLEIHSVQLGHESGASTSLQIDLDPEHEILRLHSSTPLAAGTYRLTIVFSGLLDEDLAGFYRSSFTDEAGQTRIIATTQFESTDARKAFPCFDEPDLKATYLVNIEAPSNLLVISNYPEDKVTSLGDASIKRVGFQETMPMSTYLLAFIVGPLESTAPTTDSGTPLRIISVPGKGHLTGFADRVGHHALRFFTEWFQLPYPAPKLDMIAIPDFAAGAMENLGAVTYREAVLLVDETTASKSELERVADVICHEIAHMWFGDLVTMKWWNGIWLNEAFATYMELLACDAFNPAWRRWESFGMTRLAALDVDGLPSTRPIEYEVVAPNDAEDMFDLLTYEKGASVLRMLELFLGSDNFRAGVTNYLEKHKYANAETSDLWEAIEESTSQPVQSIMQSWVFQGGHPLITASIVDDELLLTQEAFRYLAEAGDEQGSIGQNWLVPLRIRLGDQISTHLITEAELRIPLEGRQLPIVVNAGGAGVFRTRYQGELFSGIVGSYEALGVLERFNLISDSWALTLAGKESLSNFVSLVGSARSERDPNVLRLISSAIGLIYRTANEDEQPLVAALAREVFDPIAQELGLEGRDGDTQDESLARAVAFEILGVVADDKEVLEAATVQFRMDMSGVAALTPDLANAVLAVVASHGDDTEFAFMLDRYRNPRDPQDRLRNLYALTQMRVPSLLGRVAEMTKEEIRIQDAFVVLARLVANPMGGSAALEFIFSNWEVLTERFPLRAHGHMLSTVHLLCSATSYQLSGKVFDFVASHPLATGRRTMAQTLERYRLNLRFREKYAGHLGEYLS